MHSKDEAILRESYELSTLIVSAAERIKQDFIGLAHEIGLTSLSARAIITIERPMSMRQLASLLGVDASYITTLADQLERDGLARRATGNDRRIRHLELTEKGEGMRTELRRRLRQGSTVHRLLTCDERDALRGIASKLVAAGE